MSDIVQPKVARIANMRGGVGRDMMRKLVMSEDDVARPALDLP